MPFGYPLTMLFLIIYHISFETCSTQSPHKFSTHSHNLIFYRLITVCYWTISTRNNAVVSLQGWVFWWLLPLHKMYEYQLLGR